MWSFAASAVASGFSARPPRLPSPSPAFRFNLGLYELDLGGAEGGRSLEPKLLAAACGRRLALLIGRPASTLDEIPTLSARRDRQYGYTREIVHPNLHAIAIDPP